MASSQQKRHEESRKKPMRFSGPNNGLPLKWDRYTLKGMSLGLGCDGEVVTKATHQPGSRKNSCKWSIASQCWPPLPPKGMVDGWHDTWEYIIYIYIYLWYMYIIQVHFQCGMSLLKIPVVSRCVMIGDRILAQKKCGLCGWKECRIRRAPGWYIFIYIYIWYIHIE